MNQIWTYVLIQVHSVMFNSYTTTVNVPALTGTKIGL